MVSRQFRLTSLEINSSIKCFQTSLFSWISWKVTHLEMQGFCPTAAICQYLFYYVFWSYGLKILLVCRRNIEICHRFKPNLYSLFLLIQPVAVDATLFPNIILLLVQYQSVLQLLSDSIFIIFKLCDDWEADCIKMFVSTLNLFGAC